MRVEKMPDYRYHILDRIVPEPYMSRIANWYMEGYAKRHDKLMAPVLDEMVGQHTAIVPLDNLDWIEIETVNRCNRSCSWCPTNAKNDPRPYRRMTDEVFKKIIDDLASFDYKGCIAPFCYNEPAMDKGIVERMRYIKEKLPRAFKFIYTNADLLSPAKFKQWADLLDGGVIDNYSNNGKFTPHVQAIWDKYKDQYPGFIVWLRRDDEVLNTKGSEAPNRRKPNYNFKSKCYLPFTGMYIDPYGRVRLCCQDALWWHPQLGDLSTETIAEVWNGPGYRAVREHFLNGGKRKDKIVCDCCDVFHMGKNRHDLMKDKHFEKMRTPRW